MGVVSSSSIQTGRSALHETVMLYQLNDPVGEGFIKNIQLLLEYGADAGLSVFIIQICLG